MEWFTTHRLSERRSFTPEGYLLCEEVPISRAGLMQYMAGEIPLEPSRDGLIRVERTPDEVFHPDTLASFNGKPVTMGKHPPSLITPHTHKAYAVGTMFNVRRGEGLRDDYMFADLLITDAQAIRTLDGAHPELSCGYDAEYEQLEPGRGRQHKIIGNHVTILDDKGRCGPTCSIGDSAVTANNSFIERVRKAFSTNDKAAFDAAVMDLVGPPGAAPQQDPGAGPVGASGSPHRIVVNVHGGAHGGAGADAPAGGGAAAPGGGQPGVVTTPPPAVSPSQGGAGSVDQRLASMEAMLNQIMAAMGGEEEEDGAEAGMEQGQGGSGGAVPPGGEGSSESKPPPKNEEKQTGDDDPDLEAEYHTKYEMFEMKPPSGGKGDLTSAVDQGKTEGMLGDARTGGKVNGGTQDSAKLVDAWKDTVSRAEILFPGLKPKATFDTASPAKATYDCICDLRRRALEGAMGVARTKALIAPLVNRDLKGVTNDELRAMFIGASEIVRRAVNNNILRHNVSEGNQGSKGPPTNAEMNKKYEEFWNKQNGRAA
jgi:hypothetical protein